MTNIENTDNVENISTFNSTLKYKSSIIRIYIFSIFTFSFSLYLIYKIILSTGEDVINYSAILATVTFINIGFIYKVSRFEVINLNFDYSSMNLSIHYCVFYKGLNLIKKEFNFSDITVYEMAEYSGSINQSLIIVHEKKKYKIDENIYSKEDYLAMKTELFKYCKKDETWR